MPHDSFGPVFIDGLAIFPITHAQKHPSLRLQNFAVRKWSIKTL
jgi:hypothetical protein